MALEEDPKMMMPEPTTVGMSNSAEEEAPTEQSTNPSASKCPQEEKTSLEAQCQDDLVAKHRSRRQTRRSQDGATTTTRFSSPQLMDDESATSSPVANIPQSARRKTTSRRSKEIMIPPVLSEDAVAKSRGRILSALSAVAGVSSTSVAGMKDRQDSHQSVSTSTGASSSRRQHRRSKELRNSAATKTSHRSSRSSADGDIEEGNVLLDHSSDDDDDSISAYPGATAIPGIGQQRQDPSMDSRRALRGPSSTAEMAATADDLLAGEPIEAVMVTEDEPKAFVTATLVTVDDITAVITDEVSQKQTTQNCCGCNMCTWAICGISCVCILLLLVVSITVGAIYLSDVDPETLIAAIKGETDFPTMSPTSAPTFLVNSNSTAL